jgi:hypothetical protein
MSYARDLRDRLEASLQPKLAKANPLRTLGFSSELLKLGLSEDELYAHAYAVARILMGRVHPDRAENGETESQQRRVSEAFDLLKNRPLFSNWLRDFREGLDDERAEITILKRATRDLQRDNATYRQIARDAVADSKELRQRYEVVASRLQRHLLMRAAALKAGNVFTAEQSLSLRVMHFSFYEDRSNRRVTHCRRRFGEELFPVKTIRRCELEALPGAPAAPAVAIGFKTLRELVAERITNPVVGINFRTIVSMFGHYTETVHYPTGERVILGSVVPADLGAFQITGANTMVPYGLLLPALSGEIYIQGSYSSAMTSKSGSHAGTPSSHSLSSSEAGLPSSPGGRARPSPPTS